MRQHVIYPDCDIKFTGHVTWVGRSSIEAKMHMSQVNKSKEDVSLVSIRVAVVMNFSCFSSLNAE